MAQFEKKYTDNQIVDAAVKIKNGMSITQAAKELGISRAGLQDRLRTPKEEKDFTKVNKFEGKIALLGDEVRSLRSQLKIAQKADLTLKMLADELKDIVIPFPPPLLMWKKQSRGPVEESCVLHLSDGHHDAVILPHMVQGYERHDFNISMARGEYLVDTLLDFTQNRMTGFNFDTLWILAYGDHTSGEIHGSDKHSHFGSMMRNCLAIGQLHGQMFRELSAWFPNIKVLYLSGNHGRRKEVKGKDYHAAWDSWDYLIAELTKNYCRDCYNVDFLIPDSFSAVVEIEDHNFCVFHGDDIKGWSGLPWYGIARKTQRLTALSSAHDKQINYYCLGHFHSLGVQQSIKQETILNGSWIGCDPYTFNKLDGYNEPMQILHGVHKNRGVTWRLPIKLRRPEETNGPQRYKVTLATPEG